MNLVAVSLIRTTERTEITALSDWTASPSKSSPTRDKKFPSESVNNQTSYSRDFAIVQLAPSPRVLAYLAKRARKTAPTMALTTTSQPQVPDFRDAAGDDRPSLPPPPAVAVTPCDPWPRPYYLENGLRRVAPYHYTYNTYCKQRWRGREILDVFAAEFRDRSREYYKEAIEEGRIMLNAKPCKDVHTIVQNGDVISHTLHRHEPPVTSKPIRVVHESDEMIVIDKPAGVPVHPAGRYKYNSVVEIMRAERHYAFNPLPCNRLDRLTSGVMFVGKTGREAENISARLRGRTVRKEYMARVKGRFPDGEDWGGDNMTGGVVKCEEPILQISPILGLNRARASGKHAKTLFRRIAYYPGRTAKSQSDNSISSGNVKPTPFSLTSTEEDEGYSIVHCLPLTGRTHQIRVHLQFLGHPISNDPIYSNRRVFGPDLAKGDSSGDNDEEIKARLGRMGKTEIAEAYSYDADLANLVDQTQQMTVKEVELRRAEELHRKYGPTADYKPLHHGTLHAGSLGPSPSTSADTDANPNGNSEEPSSDPKYQAYVLAHDEMVADYNKRKGEKLTGEICEICQTPLYSDPGPQELGIYLHALAYADVDGAWRYTSPMPDWAMPPDSYEGPKEAPAWIYEGAGAEGLNLEIDEKEEEKMKNEKGMKKNKDQSQDRKKMKVATGNSSDKNDNRVKPDG